MAQHVHSKTAFTPEDRERHRQIREKFQREKPSVEQLVDSGEYNPPIPQGVYLDSMRLLSLLRRAREQADLSLAELAERCGIDKAALSRLESGKQDNPTLQTVLRYLFALGKRLGWVLEDLPEPTHVDRTNVKQAPSSKRWGTMIEQYEERRPLFLRKALEDAKKCCSRTGEPNDGDPLDQFAQFWLRRFSAPSEQVTGGDVRRFFTEFKLLRGVSWDMEAVARTIMKFSHRQLSDVEEEIRTLAEQLRLCITSTEKRGRQTTSVVSKIAFFGKPLQDVYIWDENVTNAARFRDWRRAGGGTKPPNFKLYTSASTHDYASFCASCAKALQEERGRSDFATAVQQFRDYLQQVGGPMADSKILGSSFIERYFLDKLMWWEGPWVNALHNWLKAGQAIGA
jgi:transcriptional regulator with XRE-family HTH domain